jgi:diguanylate cyclase (GGDEF)-like protein
LKLAKVFYRLTVPGGVILLLAFLLLRLGVVASSESPQVQLFPSIILAISVVLSAAFHRSQLFLASLVLALSHAALAWLWPRVSPDAQRVLLNAIAFLVPLNLLAFSFLRDHGIMSPSGERRLSCIGLQVLAIGSLMLPRFAHLAAWLDHKFVPEHLSAWSGIPQPALAAFVFSLAVMAVLLARRYRAVDSGVLWALISVFIALRSGGVSYVAATYFGSAGLLLTIAVLEISYSMAYHDELTQLSSRRALNEALLKVGDSYTVAMLDVDHFKKFNDTYGHQAGDQALRMVASKLAHVAGGGKAYRYGGEEFAVLFPGRCVEDACTYLDRMRRLIEQSPFVVRGPDRRRGRRRNSRPVETETHVTVSVGIATSNGYATTVDQVLRAADQALYKAKAKGRNCTVVAKIPNSRQPDLRMRVLQVE